MLKQLSSNSSRERERKKDDYIFFSKNLFKGRNLNDRSDYNLLPVNDEAAFFYDLSKKKKEHTEGGA